MTKMTMKAKVINSIGDFLNVDLTAPTAEEMLSRSRHISMAHLGATPYRSAMLGNIGRWGLAGGVVGGITGGVVGGAAGLVYNGFSDRYDAFDNFGFNTAVGAGVGAGLLGLGVGGYAGVLTHMNKPVASKYARGFIEWMNEDFETIPIDMLGTTAGINMMIDKDPLAKMGVNGNIVHRTSPEWERKWYYRGDIFADELITNQEIAAKNRAGKTSTMT